MKGKGLLQGAAALTWIALVTVAVLCLPIARHVATAFGAVFLAWWGSMKITTLHLCPRCRERYATRRLMCRPCEKEVHKDIQREWASMQEEYRKGNWVDHWRDAQKPKEKP